MEPHSKKYFSNLDGLRFILAFVVIGGHAMLGSVLSLVVPTDFLKRLAVVLNSGHLAVSFFFVLSGFLITFLMIEEKEKTGKFSITHFYLRRICRIWPLYYLTLLFGFFIYPHVKVLLGYVDQNPYSLIHQLLFLGNFDSIRVAREGLVGVAPMMIGITWSVSIEEQFYLIWPVTFAFVKPTRFWLICIFVIAGSWWFRFLTPDWNLYFHTLSVISDMGIGALGACVVYYNRSFILFMERIPKWIILVLYLLGFILLMYDDLFGKYLIAHSYRVITGLFFAFIILEQCYSSHSFYKFGRCKTISAAGKYTYALYMLHPIGIQASIIIFRGLHIDRAESIPYGLLYYFIAAVSSLVLAALSYRFIEQYFLQLRKKFY